MKIPLIQKKFPKKTTLNLKPGYRDIPFDKLLSFTYSSCTKRGFVRELK